jgi:hypothetical protein
LEANLAALDVTKKVEIYHTLYQLNSSFAAIVGHCDTLQKIGVFKSTFTRLFQNFTQELQAEFNQEFLETLHQIELDDWYKFGKVRQAREKKLRDPDDVFIHAQERKKELATHRKKSSGKKQIVK